MKFCIHVLAKMISNWQHLLELESLYGPVSSESKISIVLKKLDEVYMSITVCVNTNILKYDNNYNYIIGFTRSIRYSN